MKRKLIMMMMDWGQVVVEFTGEGEAAALDPNEWPLASLCEDLCHDIFDAVWEVCSHPEKWELLESGNGNCHTIRSQW